MRIDELLDKLKNACDKTLSIRNGGNRAADATRVLYDSRRVRRGEGGIYACVRGAHVDGHDFAKSAVDAGAVALVCDHELPLDVPQIIVSDVRAGMGLVASELLGRPGEKLKMIGLTGTNGKTTTAYLTRSILRESGAVCGMLGTIVYDDAATETYADRTTPEGPDIQDALARMVANGAEFCVMEASSHGLHQGRLASCRFDRMGFSNLTPEHLEYHSDMENYFLAKRLLFTDYAKKGWRAAVNADDEYCLRVAREFPENVRTFSAHGNSEADYKATVSRVEIDGMTMEVIFPDGSSFGMKAPLIGSYNASNILESIAICDSMGIDRETLKRGVVNCPQVPGRLERYGLENGVTVFVDYAHSSDGVEKILTALRPLTEGTLSIMWGAGGDRTPTKRPLVGEIMGRYADYCVITTDNPRSENPADIARDVERGILAMEGHAEYSIILDRGEAIYSALDRAAPGDVVVVAGKGPERTIEYATHSVPFSDNDTVLEWARGRGIGVIG